MLNYWWITRPKRKLNSVPEVLSVIAENSLNKIWNEQRGEHLNFENLLEKNELKREGSRIDQTGGGGRTYIAWIMSLGLIFSQQSTKNLQLTLAGKAILDGESPVKILTNQILKYQFPSSFSLKVKVSERFKIHPFWFLLKILCDGRINFLTQEEIAKIIITEAENETEKCFEKIISRLIEFRNFGESCLDKDFAKKYSSSKGMINFEKPFAHLFDIANTIINWLEYTQFISREDGKIFILEEKFSEVKEIVSKKLEFIKRPEEHEFFQRRYGLDLTHIKDTRNLLQTKTVTDFMIDEMRIKKIFISLSLSEPIAKISTNLIEKISEISGINFSKVEEILQKNFPHGSIGAFMTNYFEMAFSGQKQCREFEEATANIFREIFKFNSTWLGSASSGREVPDILLVSDEKNFQAIIDTKAYSKYDLPTTHRDRMIFHYLPDISNYSSSNYELKFFSYIAGGFSKNIANSLNKIVKDSGVNGSAMPVSVFIKMIEQNNFKNYSHEEIKNIFSVNRQVNLFDI